MHVPGLTPSEVATPAGIRQRAHDHERAFLCFVLQGPYEERIGGRTRRWDAQSVLLHAAGTRHADTLAPGGRLFGITFGAGWDDRLAALPSFDGVLAAAGGPPAWLMARARGELAASLPCAGLAVEGLLLEVLAAFGRPAADPGPAAVRRAEEMLRARLDHAPRLAALAREAGVEPGVLARRFRQVHGVSVTTFLRRLRVEEACRLIAGGASLVDAATAAGFADQSHLTRVFRRVTGTTPAAYRRRLAPHR